MRDCIPISEFQRHTKDAFQKATQNGYQYVTNHNEIIAVVMSVNFFNKLKKKIAKKYNCPIVSFDKDFDKTDISRLESKDVFLHQN